MAIKLLKRGTAESLGVQVGTGLSDEVRLPVDYSGARIAVQVIAVALSALTMQLQASVDGVNWNSIDAVFNTTTGELRVIVAQGVAGLRANVTALTGTSVEIKVRLS